MCVHSRMNLNLHLVDKTMPLTDGWLSDLIEQRSAPAGQSSGREIIHPHPPSKLHLPSRPTPLISSPPVHLCRGLHRLLVLLLLLPLSMRERSLDYTNGHDRKDSLSLSSKLYSLRPDQTSRKLQDRTIYSSQSARSWMLHAGVWLSNIRQSKILFKEHTHTNPSSCQ